MSEEDPRRDEPDDGDEREDDDTRVILARRRAFVVSALAGIALSTADGCKNPFVGPGTEEAQDAAVAVTYPPCLTPVQSPMPDVAVTPMPCLVPVPCLSPMPPGGYGSSTPCLSPPRPCLAPRACLSRRMPPSPPGSTAPRPCLEFAPEKPSPRTNSASARDVYDETTEDDDDVT